jgi:hypothetical protein
MGVFAATCLVKMADSDGLTRNDRSFKDSPLVVSVDMLLVAFITAAESPEAIVSAPASTRVPA